MDYALFKIINDLAGRWPVLDWLGVFCAEYLIFLMGFFIIILGFLGRDKKERSAHWFVTIEIIVAALLGYLAKIAVNLIYIRPRPFLAHDVHQLIGKLTDGSFPSMHTVVSFVMAFGVYLHNKKAGIVFFVAASFVGFSRIYSGVHYPMDVFGGIILAWLLIYLVERVEWKKLFKIK